MYRTMIGVVLLLGLIACAPEAPEPAAEPEEPAAEATEPTEPEPVAEATETTMQEQLQENEVRISVTCPPPEANGNGQGTVTVHPLRKQVGTADAPTDVIWSYQTNGPGEVSALRLQPETPETFPWDLEPIDEGNGGYNGTPNDNYAAGTWKYSITLSCNDDELTWDPRMAIGRGE